MRTTKISPDRPEDTEQTFYDALQNADLDRLMSCWADEDDMVCVLPGGPRLMGRPAIRAAFESLFANGSVRIRPERVRRLLAGSFSVHSLMERLELFNDDGPQQAWVLATNVYARTPEGWRLVAHHASPVVADEPPDPSALPSLLH